MWRWQQVREVRPHPLHAGAAGPPTARRSGTVVVMFSFHLVVHIHPEFALPFYKFSCKKYVAKKGISVQMSTRNVSSSEGFFLLQYFLISLFKSNTY